MILALFLAVALLMAGAIATIVYAIARDHRTLRRLQAERIRAAIALDHRAHVNGTLTELGRDADDLFRP